MTPKTPFGKFPTRPSGRLALGLTLLAGLAACSGDTTYVVPGSQPQPQPPEVSNPPIDTQRTRDSGLPGLNIKVVALKAFDGNGNVKVASAGDAFDVGDKLRVSFTVELDDGTPVPLEELDRLSMYVSGPTSNYQRVIESQDDVIDKAEQKGDLWTFEFPALPDVYLPPYNDSPSFGPGDGEMAGQPLLDGTYTVGIEAYKNYTIDLTVYRDPSNVVQNFLFGNATKIDARQVVTEANCNACHNNLQVHGGFRRDVQLCVLCHTSGAEDKNVASAAGGTPGTSIDFRVMIHKIHSGGHMPSVLGVTTDSSGNRVYDQGNAKKYQLVGFGNRPHDYSTVSFPVWPNLSYGMPRDVGYAAAGSGSYLQTAENMILTGVATCSKCHGDPDGSGPLPPPTQGTKAFTQPSRRACGACHDDVNWSYPYKSNLLIMPPMVDDSLCTNCHAGTGSLFPTQQVHVHPLLDPANPATNIQVTNVREQTPSGNGKLDVGEVVEFDLTITDGQGQPLDPSKLSRMEYCVQGPTWNRNIMGDDRFPPAKLTGSSVTATLPDPVFLEMPTPFLANGVSGQVFRTARAPHWNVSQADTQVFVHVPSAPGNSTTLGAAAAPFQNYLDVSSTAGFSDGDYVVLGFGMPSQEYVRVQWVDVANNRMWLASIQATYTSANARYQPWVRNDHPIGEAVIKATLDLQTDYTLDANAGTITSGPTFEAGIVVVNYVTDFAIPAKYAAPINDSPDLYRDWAEWSGLDVLDGTYTVGVWGERSFTVTAGGSEVTSYNAVSPPSTVDFLVGDTATKLQPNNIVSSGQNCYACHNDLWFHGGHRRGFDTCLMCHGNAASEDGPNYVWPTGAPTPGVGIEFRNMLHKIHMGEELTNATTYAVAGFNGTPSYYEDVVFPALPGGPAECAKCHGSSTAWEEPADRNYPSMTGALSWRVACSSCHDSSAEAAHFATMTANGLEACATCHGDGKELGVERMHRSF